MNSALLRWRTRILYRRADERVYLVWTFVFLNCYPVLSGQQRRFLQPFSWNERRFREPYQAQIPIEADIQLGATSVYHGRRRRPCSLKSSLSVCRTTVALLCFASCCLTDTQKLRTGSWFQQKEGLPFSSYISCLMVMIVRLHHAPFPRSVHDSMIMFSTFEMTCRFSHSPGRII